MSFTKSSTWRRNTKSDDTALVKHDNTHSLSEVRVRLQKLSDEQEVVAEDRLQVLIGREALTSSAKGIRQKRSRAGAAEAQLMDTFRKYYNSIGHSIPQDLALAYSNVETARNDLGLAETSHGEMEQELQISEWNLAEKEDDLYQNDLRHLLPDGVLTIDDEQSVQAKAHSVSPKTNVVAPSVNIQYQVALTKQDQINRRFNQLRRQDLHLIEHASRIPSEDCSNARVHGDALALFQLFGDTIDEMVNQRVTVQQLKVQLGPEENYSMITLHAKSDPGRESGSHRKFLDQSLGIRSDGAIPRSKDGLIHTSLAGVGDWILDCLKENAAEKMQYMTVLRDALGAVDGPSLDFGHWASQVNRLWTSDSSENMISRTRRQSLVNNNNVSEPVGVLDIHCAGEGRCISDMFTHTPVQTPDGMMNEAISFVSTLEQPNQTQLDVPTFHFECSSDGTDNLGEGTSISREPPLFEPPPERQPDTMTSLSVPVWRVIAPEDIQQPDRMGSSSMHQLRPGQSGSVRCDSAHNSDSGERQHIETVPISYTMQPVDPKPVQDFAGAANKEITETMFNSLGHDPTGNVTRYSDWTWSPDLRLYYRNGFGEDDEVIEEMWLRSSDDEQSWSRHAKSPTVAPLQERPAPVHGGAILFDGCDNLHPYSPTPQHPTSEGSWRSRSDTASSSAEPGPSYESRYWRSTQTRSHREHVELTTSRYNRVRASQRRQFFTTGRVFKVLWCEPRRNSLESSSQSSRESSATRSVCNVHNEVRYFVVIKDGDAFSICVPIQPYVDLKLMISPPGPENLGSIYTSGTPILPWYGDMYGRHPVRVELSDEDNDPLPTDLRANYGESYEIAHDTKLVNIGMVAPQHHPYLLANFKQSIHGVNNL